MFALAFSTGTLTCPLQRLETKQKLLTFVPMHCPSHLKSLSTSRMQRSSNLDFAKRLFLVVCFPSHKEKSKMETSAEIIQGKLARIIASSDPDSEFRLLAQSILSEFSLYKMEVQRLLLPDSPNHSIRHAFPEPVSLPTRIPPVQTPDSLAEEIKPPSSGSPTLSRSVSQKLPKSEASIPISSNNFRRKSLEDVAVLDEPVSRKAFEEGGLVQVPAIKTKTQDYILENSLFMQVRDELDFATSMSSGRPVDSGQKRLKRASKSLKKIWNKGLKI